MNMYERIKREQSDLKNEMSKFLYIVLQELAKTDLYSEYDLSGSEAKQEIVDTLCDDDQFIEDLYNLVANGVSKHGRKLNGID